MRMTLEQIQKTYRELAPFVRQTPIWPLTSVSQDLGIEIVLKLELFQVTGTFKARGAFNVMRQLSKEQLSKGVTAVSGGNHAVAVAYVAKQLKTSAKVVMPVTANRRRRELCQRFGAEVVTEPDIQRCFDRAATIQTAEGRFFVHPFEGLPTVLGTSGVGLEIMDQVSNADGVVVPIGGGGLCAGIATAVKLINPKCQVFGVEPEGSDVMHRSFQSGKPERLNEIKSIADSLGAPMTGELVLELCLKNVDGLVKVSDAQMRSAMQVLFLEAKLAVEPAGAASLAAICGPLKARLAGKKVVALVCGANIDVASFAALLQL